MIKNKKQGQLIVVSAPSGAGKDTVVKKLVERGKNDYWISISATSRPIRKGDQEGVDYYFISKEEFKKRIKEGYFLEYTKYADNYYGTPKQHIKENLEKGKDVILIIEIEGAANVKEMLPESLLIFIMPPSIKELVRRLKKRGTEDNDKLLKRFHKTYKEINEVTKYNYVVVNDNIEDAVDKIEAIIKAEKCRVDRIEEVFLDTKEEEIHELLMQEDFDNTPTVERLEGKK